MIIQKQKLSHVELFSGLGSASIALRSVSPLFETVAYSEICTKAEAVRAVLVKDGARNIGDLTDDSNWRDDKRLKDIDLVTAGFPCQDFSGMNSKALGWNSPRTRFVTNALHRYVSHTQPKYIVMENVKNLFCSTHIKGTKSFLDSFSGYSWNHVSFNPADYGYIQSRGRVYILLCRKDVPQAELDLNAIVGIKQQTFSDVMDKRTLKDDVKGEYYHVKTQSRIESAKKSNRYWQLTPRSTRMQTMGRRSIDARCNRFSWVKGNPDPRYSHRSLSVKEALRIQGHSKIPSRLSSVKGLSRSSCFMAIGNAWHIGAAVQVLKQLPIQGLLEFKFRQWASKFIRWDKVEALARRKTAQNIRARYLIEDLMTSGRSSNRRALFATSSYKFDKKDGKKIETRGVYLAPAKRASRPSEGIIINSCPNAGECAKEKNCLIGSGTMPFHSDTRQDKTLFFYGYPAEYLIQIIREIVEFARKAHKRGDELQVRLNGTSDIQWERYLYMDMLVASVIGFIGFYDYTKNGVNRLSRIEQSYHLTFSVSEDKNTMKNALEYLKAGFSVSIVTIPNEHDDILNWGHPRVLDGELNDHRPQDPPGSVVLLPARGELRSQIGKTKFVKSRSWVAWFLTMVDSCPELA